MQGISAKEHQAIIAAFNKFEQMAMVAGSNITEQEDEMTRKGITELRMIYGEFQHMLQELQCCVKRYEMRRRSVQSLMNRNIRRMNPEVQKRKRYLK